MQLAGVEASLRWGYTHAAALGAWSVVKQDDGSWSATAAIVSVDAFRVTQRPLVFEARHAKGAWRWPVQELQIAARSLTATLGACEG